jgi:hypothetical protein
MSTLWWLSTMVHFTVKPRSSKTPPWQIDLNSATAETLTVDELKNALSARTKVTMNDGQAPVNMPLLCRYAHLDQRPQTTCDDRR